MYEVIVMSNLAFYIIRNFLIDYTIVTYRAISRQRLGKHIPAAKKMQATIR
jgi:hypothetical protein